MTLKVAQLARERINEHMRKGAQVVVGKGKGGYVAPAENPRWTAWMDRPGPPGWTDGRMDMLQPKKESQDMDIQAEEPEGSQDGPPLGAGTFSTPVEWRRWIEE